MMTPIEILVPWRCRCQDTRLVLDILSYIGSRRVSPNVSPVVIVVDSRVGEHKLEGGLE